MQYLDELRVALEREGLLKAQARALLEAAAGKTLNVMFPMVSEPWEFDAAKAVFDAQLKWLKGQKKMLPLAIRYDGAVPQPYRWAPAQIDAYALEPSSWIAQNVPNILGEMSPTPGVECRVRATQG